jgi:hypothetical protein
MGKSEAKMTNKDSDKRFDEKFTRKNLSTGELEERWFVRETTAKELKSFLHQELDRARKEEREQGFPIKKL